MGGERCVKPVLLSIMSRNKHLHKTNVLLPHAVKSDETAVRKYPYPSRVSSNWRSPLPSLVLFDRYCSITTPALSTAQDNIHSAITTLICVTRWYVIEMSGHDQTWYTCMHVLCPCADMFLNALMLNMHVLSLHVCHLAAHVSTCGKDRV